MRDSGMASTHLQKTLVKSPLTAAACALCVIVFFGIAGQSGDDSWQSVARWGYLPPDAIWNGAYWALISSVFAHLEIWHIVFNLYWLWILGSALEQSIGSLRWLAFFVAAAFVSSSVQLATGDLGIGMSGVGYALFGFAWVARERMPAFREILTEQTISLFLIWLVGCAIATALNIVSIGNGAHIAGLVFGVLVAEVFVRRARLWMALPALVALSAAAFVPLFWCPLSAEWNAQQAGRAHERGDYTAAIHWYHDALRRGADASWAWHNLAMIHGYDGNAPEYATALRELRKVDEKAAREVEVDYGRPSARPNGQSGQESR